MSLGCILNILHVSHNSIFRHVIGHNCSRCYQAVITYFNVWLHKHPSAESHTIATSYTS